MTTRRRRRWQRAIDALLHSPEPMMITQVRASRAIYGDEDHSEIEITLEVEGGAAVLQLRMPPRLAHRLNREMTTAYLAINPPLSQGGQNMAQWQGMGQ